MKERLSSEWKLFKDRIYTIPNVLVGDLRKENRIVKASRQNLSVPGYLENKFVLIYVSRFYSHKNHDFIVKLAQHLKKKGVLDIVFLLLYRSKNTDGEARTGQPGLLIMLKELSFQIT